MRKRKPILGLDPNVFFLGLVSFLTDISSELIFTLMPLFLANVLGASTVIIGFISGVADSTASLLNVFSGWFSDRLGKRKYLSFVGYALSSLSKPFMLIAGTWGPIMAIRFADRVGKGIRTAPRDALVADSTAEEVRGRAFGFHRAMDTGGAALGLLAAAVVVYFVQGSVLDLQFDTYRWLIILGLIPALLALFFFIFVQEPQRQLTNATSTGGAAQRPALPGKFKILLALMFLFTLGNSSDAFLILRAQNLGNDVLMIAIMLVMFNLVYALFSTPAGIVSDKLGRRNVIVVGWAIYALVYLGFALSNEPWTIWLLWAFYGLYYGLADGVGRALVSDLVPGEARGTAFGMYNGVVGITLLPASLIAGWLWQSVNPSAPFYFGSALAVLAMLGMVLFIRR
ncbi:MAG: MFS transporter [Dehalococcoidia bacterium]|jgi:MFS family permease